MLLRIFPAINDNERLARSDFAPENIDSTGNILPSAISSKDLKDRGYSVDRSRYLILSTLRTRIDEQQAKLPEKRTNAFVSEFQHNQISSIVHPTDHEAAFEIKADPIRKNAAHVVILSANEGRSPSAIRALRSELLPLLQPNLKTAQDFVGELKLRRKGEGRRTAAMRRALHIASYALTSN